MKEMKAHEKVAQKMTHDGAVEENLSTGEVSSISAREEEREFSAADETETIDAIAVEATDRFHRRKVKKASNTSKTDICSVPRMHFSDKDLQVAGLERRISRTEKAADRLGESRIRFENAANKGNRNLFHSPTSRPVWGLRFATHSLICEDEQENVGVEAGHSIEEQVEQTVHFAKDCERSALQRHRKAVRRAEKSTIRANADFLYEKALLEEPLLANANPVSKYLQKQRIRRSYARQVYHMEKNAQNPAAASKRAVRSVKEATQRAAAVLKHHSKGAMLVIGMAAILVMLLGGVASCSMMATSGVGGVVSSSYFSDDADMMAAEAAYCAMEAELQAYLDTYESTHNYNEYVYDLDEIGHDPYVLTSILSALHDGVFTIDEVQGELEILFEKQYILTETIAEETRYRTETRIETVTVTDPKTGEETMEEQEVEVEVPYAYYICNVGLENLDLSHVPICIMSEAQLSMYATYMSTLGNREDLFPDSDYISLYATNTPTDYEVPYEYLQDNTFALILVEAEKYLGYPYVWGGSNPNTSFDCSGYVSWVLTNSGVCDPGRLGAQGLYNISTPVSASNAKPGDLVFFMGTYDTEGISHVGIYVGDGMMIHCGDPIQYTSINTTYWQSHFYAFARPPYN